MVSFNHLLYKSRLLVHTEKIYLTIPNICLLNFQVFHILRTCEVALHISIH